MRRVRLALGSLALIIAACAQKTAPPQPVPLPAEQPATAVPAPSAEVPPLQKSAPTPAPQPTTPPPAPPAAVKPQPKTVTITMNDQGFSPATVTIKKGDTVVFKNTGTQPMWPASAVHPSHGAYPEPGGCIGSKFDACKGVKPGESWSFTFNQVGSWGFHDHLSPALRGKVEVTE